MIERTTSSDASLIFSRSGVVMRPTSTISHLERSEQTKKIISAVHFVHVHIGQG
jgi:hypothetical protein